MDTSQAERIFDDAPSLYKRSLGAGKRGGREERGIRHTQQVN